MTTDMITWKKTDRVDDFRSAGLVSVNGLGIPAETMCTTHVSGDCNLEYFKCFAGPFT